MIIAEIQEPRYLILETGLGGRLDATRCASADICILTSISAEHTDILGDNINQIIAEKAAIGRPGKPIIVKKWSYHFLNGQSDLLQTTALKHYLVNPIKKQTVNS